MIIHASRAGRKPFLLASVGRAMLDCVLAGRSESPLITDIESASADALEEGESEGVEEDVWEDDPVQRVLDRYLQEWEMERDRTPSPCNLDHLASKSPPANAYHVPATWRLMMRRKEVEGKFISVLRSPDEELCVAVIKAKTAVHAALCVRVDLFLPRLD